MKINLSYLAHCLFTLDPWDLLHNKEICTDEFKKFGPYVKSENVGVTQLPTLSIAYVRQLFFRQLFPNAQERETLCAHYQISDKETYSPEMDMAQRDQQAKYISGTHCIFEDHGVEGRYVDFYTYYSCAQALLWCVNHGLDWEEYED